MQSDGPPKSEMIACARCGRTLAAVIDGAATSVVHGRSRGAGRGGHRGTRTWWPYQMQCECGHVWRDGSRPLQQTS